MTRTPPFGELPAVFPDWSPYPDLESAARAYLRDPEVAMEALNGVLRGSMVLGFALERFVNDVNGVWQEVVVCDGTRLILWHGEDVPPADPLLDRPAPGRQHRRVPAAQLAGRGRPGGRRRGWPGGPARRAAVRQDTRRRRFRTDRPA